MLKPRDLCPITGQPLVCSTCGGDLSDYYLCSGRCFRDEEGCEFGNCYPDYNERIKEERLNAAPFTAFLISLLVPTI